MIISVCSPSDGVLAPNHLCFDLSVDCDGDIPERYRPSRTTTTLQPEHVSTIASLAGETGNAAGIRL
jgi:hypothetical protein